MKLKAASDQLGSVVQLVSFTGAGQPRPFKFWLVAKGKPGFTWNAWLWKLSIDREGFSRIELNMDNGFEMAAVSEMMGSNVVFGFKDEEEGKAE